MKILQILDEETGALMATVPIKPIQEKVIISIMASLNFRGWPEATPEDRAWRLLEALARERAQELEGQRRALFMAAKLLQAQAQGY